MYRQGRVLALLTIANAACRAGFLAAVWRAAPAWSLLAVSARSGATMPAIGALVRARWSHLFRGSPLLDAALSFESSVDASILIAAPVTVSMLAVYLNPAAGMIFALLLAAAGSAPLASQLRTELSARRPARGAGRPAFPRGFPLLILTFIAIGAAQTIIDIGTVAFSGEQSARERAVV